MTAIFAFVENGTAFVAADTRRAAPGLQSVATKVYYWSEHILIAQTGVAKPLDGLVNEMILWRDRKSQFREFAGLVELYKHRRPDHQAKAAAALGVSVGMVCGSIIVAVAENLTDTATIATLDFATEKVTKVASSGSVYADGTDPPAFQIIAVKEMAAQRRTGGSVALDQWAMNCIGCSVQTNGNEVGWPADMIISRWHPQPIRVATIRRVRSSSEGQQASYSLP